MSYRVLPGSVTDAKAKEMLGSWLRVASASFDLQSLWPQTKEAKVAKVSKMAKVVRLIHHNGKECSSLHGTTVRTSSLQAIFPRPSRMGQSFARTFRLVSAK